MGGSMNIPEMPELGTLVELEYYDIQRFTNAPASEIDMASVKCWGKLFYHNTGITIIQHATYTDDNETGDYTAIPTGCITACRRIE